MANLNPLASSAPGGVQTVNAEGCGHVPESARVDPELWVSEYGDLLFGFAVARVRDRAVAQDLVQETFLAAIRAAEKFSGKASERAWLFGILRNKLIDYYRRQCREISLADIESPLPEEKGAFGEHGIEKDGWISKLAPRAWESPDQDLVRKEFQSVLTNCIECLPARLAQVFLLREVDGIPAEEICKDLGLSPNNLWVMLHRARMGLRRCLELHWFRNDPESK